MKRALLVAGCFLASTVVRATAVTATSVHPTSHMADFKIFQCDGPRCLHASGKIAFVSALGTSLSAADVRLELKVGSKTEIHQCANFRYDLTTQHFRCETAGAEGLILSIDEHLQVLRYPMNEFV